MNLNGKYKKDKGELKIKGLKQTYSLCFELKNKSNIRALKTTSLEMRDAIVS